MIIIEQLLESVDLNFEPRWVTKDEDGTVSIWEKKPERCDDFYRVDSDNVGEVVMCPKLKLSEFHNKNWTECIYEVPRKTTGNLKHIERIDDSFVDKINAIIDAVNELKGTDNE